MADALAARVPKKRKHVKTKHSTEIEEQVEEFTVPEFKVLVKDPGSIFIAYEKFHKYAEWFLSLAENQRVNKYDLIFKYLKSSPECSEIFDTLNSKNDWQIKHVHNTLACILNALAGRLFSVFPAASDNICKQLTNGNHYQKLLNHAVTGYELTARAALGLLTAVAKQGSKGVRIMLDGMTITQEVADILYKKRAQQGSLDTRSDFIYLLMTMLQHGAQSSLISIIEAKGLFTSLFAYLFSDTVSNVELVLQTLKTRVLQNPRIRKTQKIQLFNQTSVLNILKAFKWHGPAPRRIDKTTNLVLFKPGPVSEEDLAKVQMMMYNFVSLLLSNRNEGIIFYDPTVGTGDRNENHIVTEIITTYPLISSYNKPGLEQVVIECLNACPDQVSHYMRALGNQTLAPKDSELWHSAVNHVIKVYNSLPKLENYLNVKKILSVDTLVAMAINLTSPEQNIVNFFKHAIGMPQLKVKLAAAEMLLVIMNRAKEAVSQVKNYCEKTTQQEVFTQWLKDFTNQIHMLMPNYEQIHHSWKATVKVKADANKDYMEDQRKVASRLLDLILLYMEVIAEAIWISESHVDVPDKLHEVSALMEAGDDNSEVERMMQLKVLNLLRFTVGMDGPEILHEKRLKKGHKKVENKRTMLSCLIELAYSTDGVTDEARQLLNEVMLETGWFPGSLSLELNAWLSFCDSDVYPVLDKCFHQLLENPFLHLTQVEQIVAEAEESKLGSLASDSSVIPLSPLVFTSNKVIKEDGENTNRARLYFERVWMRLLAVLDNPVSLALALQKLKVKINSPVLSKLCSLICKSRKCTLSVAEFTDVTEDTHCLLWKKFFCHDGSDVNVNIPEQLSAVECRALTQHLMLCAWQISMKQGSCNLETVFDLVKLLPHQQTTLDQLLQSGFIKHYYLSSPIKNGHVTKSVNILCAEFISSFTTEEQHLFASQLEECAQRFLKGLNEGQILQKHRCNGYVLGLKAIAHGVSGATLYAIYNKLFEDKWYEDLEEVEDEIFWSCVDTMLNAIVKYNGILHAGNAECVEGIVRRGSPRRFTVLYHLMKALYRPDFIPCGQLSISCRGPTDDYVSLLTWLVNHSQFHAQHMKDLIMNSSALDQSYLPVYTALFQSYTTVSKDLGKHVCKLLWNEILYVENLSESKERLDLLLHLVSVVSKTKAEKAFQHCVDILSSEPSALGVWKLCISLVNHCPECLPRLYVQVITLLERMEEECVKLLCDKLNTNDLREDEKNVISAEISTQWKQFIMTTLRSHYRDGLYMKLVSTLTSLVYPGNTDMTASEMFDLLISHSQFLNVMLSSDPQQKHSCQDALVSIISTLVDADPAGICKPEHFALWLSAYGATMSATDQKILRLMYVYERQGISTVQYRPFVWGKAGTKHYRISQDAKPTVITEPSVISAIEALDRELLVKSALRLPLHRELISHEILSPTEAAPFDIAVYDPAFLLPLFAYIVRPDHEINTRLLVNRHIIPYTIACLTSHSVKIRAAARHILHEFYQHAEASTFQENTQHLYLLDLVKESIIEKNGRLSTVTALFLSESLTALPQDHMYQVCHNFLLISPTLDLTVVPEFLRLFNSTNAEYEFERMWILKLLLNGFREQEDLQIYEKLQIFKIIMTFANCSLCNADTRDLILKVLIAGCQLNKSCEYLTNKCALVSYFTGLVQDYPEVVPSVLVCLQTMQANIAKDKSWYLEHQHRQMVLLLTLLRTQRINASDVKPFVELMHEMVSTIIPSVDSKKTKSKLKTSSQRRSRPVNTVQIQSVKRGQSTALPVRQIRSSTLSALQFPITTVNIVGGDNDGEQITLALSPDMSVYDTLKSAKTFYAYTYNRDYNPYGLSLHVLEAKRCAAITTLGGVTGPWLVKVTNHTGELIHSDTCIPRRSHLTVRSGYTVTLIRKPPARTRQTTEIL